MKAIVLGHKEAATMLAEHSAKMLAKHNSQPQHTPGPWKVYEELKEENKKWAALFEEGLQDTKYWKSEAKKLKAANAKLLEALKLAANFIENGESGDKFFEVRAAWRRAFAAAE